MHSEGFEGFAFMSCFSISEFSRFVILRLELYSGFYVVGNIKKVALLWIFSFTGIDFLNQSAVFSFF